MSARFVTQCLLLCALASGAGCSAEHSGSEGSGAAPKLLPISYAAWQERLAAGKGDIIVVDFWATWSPLPRALPAHGATARSSTRSGRALRIHKSG